MYKILYDTAAHFNADFVDCSYITMSNGQKHVSTNSHPKRAALDRNYLLSHVIPTLVGVKNAPKEFIGNTVWNKIFRLETVKAHEIQFDATRMKYEDRLFVVEFLNHASTGVFIEDALYTWARRDGSLLTRYNPEEARAVISNQIRYRQLFGAIYDFDSSEAVDYRIGAINDVLWSIISREHPSSRRDKVEEVLANEHVRHWIDQGASLKRPTSLLIRTALSLNLPTGAYLSLRLRFLPRSVRHRGGQIIRKWRDRSTRFQ